MHEFVLDLTSVCVRTGALQLPYKMVSRFEEGVLKALAGGGEVELTFCQPRTLTGLKQYFESQGLRANDRLRIEFVGDSDAVAQLKLIAERRERPKPADTTQRAAANQSGASSALFTRAATDRGDETSSMVRAVRKVRIEAQPRVTEPEAEPIVERETVADATRGSTRGWAPLDDVSRRQVAASASELEPLTSVRVVRRGQPRVEADGTTGGAAQTQSQAPENDGPADVARFAPDIQPPTVDVATPKQSEARRTPSQLMSRFGVRFWSDRSSSQPIGDPTDELISEADLLTEDVEATLEVPVAATVGEVSAQLTTGAEAPEAVVIAEAAPLVVVSESSERQAFEAFLGEREDRADERPSAVWRRAARPGAATRRPPAPEASPAGPSESSAAPVLTGGSERPAPGPLDATSQALSRGEIRVAPLRSAAPPVSETADAAPPPGQPKRVEDVMPTINQYLMRPQTPAIVQTSTLAQDLGLDLELAERAMERLSEDRDRFNQIRPGAYMVRRTSVL